MNNVLHARFALAKGIRVERVVAILALLAMVGCSGDSSGRSEVSGTVLVNGKPPKTGAIAFSPVDGAAPTAGGKIVDGNYSVQVPLGVAAVSIRVPKVAGEKKLYDTPDSPVRKVNVESLPEKYNFKTELTYEVVPGVNEHDFDLKTDE